MNTTYLAIEAFITIFVIYTIIHSDSWWSHHAHDGKQFLSIIMFIVSVAMLPIGFVPGNGEPHLTVKDAYSQKMGNEVIVKVDGWPTQITDKIEFVDVPLQIKRIEPRNAWNIDCTSSYRFDVQVNKPSIKTELQ
jgi:hypothetical protein